MKFESHGNKIHKLFLGRIGRMSTVVDDDDFGNQVNDYIDPNLDNRMMYKR